MIETRTTDWIMTASGRPFWPLEPRVEDVEIGDIAHHLSNLCRFTGAVRSFYSVAQHSVLVSRCVSDHLWRAGAPGKARVLGALYGLLHDGSEAYLIDVPRPVKREPKFSVYRDIEAAVQSVVYRAFDMSLGEEPEILKHIDRRMLRTEQRDLMPPACLDERRDDVEPYDWTITPQRPEIARGAFLSQFNVLQGALSSRTYFEERGR